MEFNRQKIFQNRKVVLDVETTGTDIHRGDRVLSIALLELENDLPTGEVLYKEINPDKTFLEEEQTKIHGFTLEYLKDKPRFHEVAQEIIDFIGDSEVIIHNVIFDTLFLKKEFEIAGYNPSLLLNKTICTVELARNLLPIYRVSLDRLCSYFKIPSRKGKIHSALEDVELLSKVYWFLRNSYQSNQKSIFETLDQGSVPIQGEGKTNKVTRKMIVDLEGLREFRKILSPGLSEKK